MKASEPIKFYWEVVDPIWNLMSIDDPESFAATSAQVTRPGLLLYAAHFADSEICNGGFLQFFRNSTGVLAPEAIETFRAIGMPNAAQLIEDAALRLGPVYPRGRKDRWRSMLANSGLDEEALAKIFEECKDEYRAYRRVTECFAWERLERQYFAIRYNENGGFEVAATAYANRTITE